MLATGKSAAITALQGMGGIGKTALALVLAQRLKADFPGGVFWADLVGHGGSAEPILREWGAVCGADLSREPDPTVLAGRVRGLLAQRQREAGAVLAVVDDVRSEPQTWLAAAQLLQGCLPEGVPLLLTTREELMATALGAEIERLDLLPLVDAQTLLAERVKDGSLLQPDEMVRRLLDALGYLPLAIRLAAGYLTRRGRKPGFELTGFVAEIEAGAATRLDTPTAGLAATFQITYGALSEVQQRVFRYCSVYAAPLLTVEHLAALLAMDGAVVEEILDGLVEVALLAWDAGRAGRYVLHPLLGQYGYGLLGETDERQAIHRRAAAHLGQLAQYTPDELLEEVDQWAKAADWAEMAGRASGLVGRLSRHGYWADIDERLVTAQEGIAQETGQERVWAMVLNARGLIANKQARWDKAIGYYEQSLQTKEQVGDVHGMAQTYNNLGIAYKSKGEWDKAIGYYEQSLQTKEQVGDVHGMAQTYNNLGLAYKSKGEWDKAIGYYEQSLQTKEQVGDVHGMALTYGNLGLAYKSKGEWDKAIGYYEQSLKIDEQVGDVHGMAQTYNNLGLAYKSKGEWDKAIGYYEQSLQTKEQVGDVHGMALTYGNLGNAYQSKGEWDKAIGYHEQDLQISEQVGDVHGMAQTYNNLGNAYQSKGEWDKAIGYYEQSLQTKEQVGDVHGMAQTYNNLGIAYKSKGEWDKAIGYYEQSLQTKEQVGDVHGMAQTYNNLGLAYKSKGEWDKAIGYYEQSLQTKEQVGDVHGMALTYGNLGVFHHNRGNANEAASYMARAYLNFARLGAAETGQAGELLVQFLGSPEVAQAYLEKMMGGDAMTSLPAE